MFQLMLLPFLACLILTGMHVYLGLHVIKRNIIFVDLALAQLAALGGVIALVFGCAEKSLITYILSLVCTFSGAWAISTFHKKNPRLSAEVFIGIIYVMATTLAILLVSKSTVEADAIKQMLSGNILLVSTADIIKTFVLYGLIGLVHFLFRKQFWAVTASYQNKVPVQMFWDLLFYMLFGIVVTSSVKIAGVLLVFSYLIIPAAIAIGKTSSTRNQLLIGWGIGAVASLIGIILSAAYDLPTGPIIVAVFGIIFGLVITLNKKLDWTSMPVK